MTNMNAQDGTHDPNGFAYVRRFYTSVNITSRTIPFDFDTRLNAFEMLSVFVQLIIYAKCT